MPNYTHLHSPAQPRHTTSPTCIHLHNIPTPHNPFLFTRKQKTHPTAHEQKRKQHCPPTPKHKRETTHRTNDQSRIHTMQKDRHDIGGYSCKNWERFSFWVGVRPALCLQLKFLKIGFWGKGGDTKIFWGILGGSGRGPGLVCHWAGCGLVGG